MGFKKMTSLVKSRDVCMVAVGYQATVADQWQGNLDHKVQKCEYYAACLASYYDEEKDNMKEVSENCVVGITDGYAEAQKDEFTIPEVAGECTENFPTLEGTPFHHE